MAVLERVADAEALWRQGRREGALLLVLVAVAAAARASYPAQNDHAAFVDFMKSTHPWALSIEFRGNQVDIDELFYVWLRCELVHRGELPVDIQIDDALPELTIRAGGAPEYVVRVSPAWFDFLIAALRAR